MKDERSYQDDHDACDELYFEETENDIGTGVLVTTMLMNPYVRWLESKVASEIEIEHKAELIYEDPEYALDQDEDIDDGETL